MSEDEIFKEIEELYQSVSNGNKKTFFKEIMQFIDYVQREAFMEGYRYAITLLEESVVK